jgi:hypothetical protein
LTLIAYFQDLSKVDTLVLVRVLDLTKTRTTLDKKMFLPISGENGGFFCNLGEKPPFSRLISSKIL